MDKEYVEREALRRFPIRLNHYDKEHGNEHFVLGIESVLEYAESLPAADVAPVRHGYWKEKHRESYLVSPMKYDENGEPILQEYSYYECSLCGRTEKCKEPYCNCGAKMDGGK